MQQTAEGAAAATQVAARLGEIAQGVGEVNAVVSEIGASTKEQPSGIAAIVGATTEMDEVTPQNAASAEESSSAAAELSSQAEELAAMVATFQLSLGRAPAPAGAPRLALVPPPRAPGGWERHPSSRDF